jgi:hypothetical protein
MVWSRERSVLAAVVLGGLAVAAVATTAATTPTMSPSPSALLTPQTSRTPTMSRPPQASSTPLPAHGVLRVYSNNIENLVRNDPDGACTRISGREHLASMLVDGAGETGTGGVAAPDLVLLQQVSGAAQAESYANLLSARFGLSGGTYRAIVAWHDPEEWGSSHHCRDRSLGDLKKKQTNAILYNSRTLALTDTSKYWSAGWLQPGTAYADGNGCVAYEPPNVDAHSARATNGSAPAPSPPLHDPGH